MRGCVAVLSGLNLLRETATHFPQELVLKSMLQTSKANGRPLILHCAPRHIETAERLLTIIEEWQTENGGASPMPIIMHAFLTATNFNIPLIRKFAQLGCFFSVSAAELHLLCGGTSAPEAAAAAGTVVRSTKQAEEDLAAFIDCLFNVIPQPQLLLSSDSPWHTPQTIDDDYVRTQKNEPSNLPNVVEALELAVKTFASSAAEEAKKTSVEELLAKLKTFVTGSKETAVKVFAIPAKDVEVAAPAAEKEKGKSNNEDEDEQPQGKKSGKGKSQAQAQSDDEADGKKKKKKKGARFQESESEEEVEAKGKGSAKGKGKKGGKAAANESDDEEPSAKSKKDQKRGKRNNDDNSDAEDEPKPTKKREATQRSLDSVHYACQKCRAKLFTPADLIVPSDPSLCATGFFVKPVAVTNDANNDGDEEEEDENNKLLPPSLRISTHTNGEIECKKCGAAKIGRAGFKLGVPGFGIKITPSKVEVVDTEVSLEELQRKALLENERYAQEAEALENASSDDDDRKGKRTQKKNVKTNNKSNFTTFRNKNFAPKTVRLADAATEELPANDNDEADQDSDDDTNRKPK
eukprot:GILJ01018110.1.p1 GENE.GILJ01018110.1~~GILJ01018110.1.p1  ORF type:complete len:608 (+),score=136.82 GILJ01018110.1:93-1826(+)